VQFRFLTVIGVVAALAASLAVVSAGSAAPGARVGPVTASASKYGKVLFDGRGRSLYVFAADRRGKSSCYGGCIRVWPPLLTSSKAMAHAGAGARQGLIGTTRRRDGKLQVTYAGHPLYGFSKDTKRGQITCQNVANFGAKWWVITAAGKVVR
jgi:predicted lipoprotein with Yx(FWY)xxD motif